MEEPRSAMAEARAATAQPRAASAQPRSAMAEARVATAQTGKQLSEAAFAAYPPQARALAVGTLPLLRELPILFASVLLREISRLDWKLPAERRQLEAQLTWLSRMTPAEREQTLGGFAALPLSAELQAFPWAAQPTIFSERLTAYLWSAHQMDNFRAAAESYAQRMAAAVPDPPPAVPRLSVVIAGSGVMSAPRELFRKLRTQGTAFTNVTPEGGGAALFEAVARRAQQHPAPFAHWYVDGASPELRMEDAAAKGVATLSYAGLEPVRMALLARMHNVIHAGDVGPEGLRTLLAEIDPGELHGGGSASVPGDPLLTRFALALLTEGSGTQIFSTTFVQWAAREILRRAQPLTLLTRYAPRQREQSMNALLSQESTHSAVDPEGSLVDAEMGAFYTWVNLRRLTGAEEAVSITWFEGHGQAVVIAPGMAKGATSDSRATVGQLLGWAGVA